MEWSGRAAVSLRISQSDGRLFGVIKAPELISFDCPHCYFLMVVLSLSVTRCEKAEIRQRIAFSIYGFLHSRMRIDMPCDGVHDGVWCSPFELVLATNLLPKRQRPYQVLNVGLTDRFGIEWASEALGDAHKSAVLGV
jgi:hypothetical protein